MTTTRIALVLASFASVLGAPAAQAQSYTAPAGIPAAAGPSNATLRINVLSAPRSFTADQHSTQTSKSPACR